MSIEQMAAVDGGANPVAEVLTKAKALIADPTRWIKEHSYATTVEGITVASDHPAATCFCALGAIRRIRFNLEYSTGRTWWVESANAQFALQQVVGGSIIDFNDTHTHAEVMGAYDKAIAKAAGVAA